MHRIIPFILFLTLGCPLIVCGQAQQSNSQESLGDLARQLRKQQGSSSPKTGTVFTNDNMPAPKPGEAVSSLPIAEETPAEGADSKGKGTETKPPTEGSADHESKPSGDKMKTKEYWQGKFKAARQDLAKAKQQQQLSEDELNLLQIQQVRELDPNAKDNLTAKVQAKQSEVDVNTATTQAAQKALEDLEQEFKDSGAPEEWSKTDELETETK